MATALRARGLEVVLTCEPTDGPLGRQIREYFQGPTRYLSPKEELNLFMADRREHVAEVIEPSLAEGKIVITDRYYYSSVAYQGALGLDQDRILAQNEVHGSAPGSDGHLHPAGGPGVGAVIRSPPTGPASE